MVKKTTTPASFSVNVTVPPELLERLLAERIDQALARVQTGLGVAPKLRGAVGYVATSKQPATRPPGAKRSANELAQVQRSILSVVKRSPGLKVEELAQRLGTTTSQIKSPALKLRAANQLRTEGERRGMRYFPSTGA